MIPDFYMEHSNVVDRLIGDWKTHGKLIVAFDFDNTVYDYHGEGHSYKQVCDLLRACKNLGAYLIVFSVSGEDRYPFIKQYLDEQGIQFDSINEDMPGLPFKGGKIYYNILLDDRAGLESAYTALKHAVDYHIMHREEF